MKLDRDAPIPPDAPAGLSGMPEIVVAPRPAMSIAQAATRGLAWMTAASLAAKVVGFAQTIVLAWFLNLDDLGLLTMAGTITAFVIIPLRFSLEEILIQRFRRFHLWSGPAFWLSAASGVGTMALLLCAAPAGAWFYGSAKVAPLIAVFAATNAAASLMSVPFAKLSAELRFRSLAGLAIGQMLVQTAVSLPLASAGAGAMSVAIGSLAAAAFNTAGHWWLARVGPPGPPRVRRWRFFFRDTGMLQGGRFATAVASNVDFITVGRLGGKGPLGIYSFAYNQSLQAMRLVAANAASVLFPSLSSFGDDVARKYAAFLRGMALVLPLLVPFCLLQAALADPAIRLLFRPMYWPGVPLFQILSFGTIGVGVATLCHSFLLSMRRNDLSFATGAGSAACYCVAAPLGWLMGGTAGVAIAMTLAATLCLAFAHWLCARAAGRPLVAAVPLYLRASLLAVASCAPPWLLVTFALPPGGPHPAWQRLVIGAIAFGGIYPPLLWLVARETFRQIASRVPLRIVRALAR